MARGDVFRMPDGSEVILGDVGQEVILETDLIRVWHLELEPGESQPWHLHHNPYLIIAIEAADNRITYADGTSRDVHEHVGRTIEMVPTPVHMLTNVGTTRYVNRLIEFKDRGENLPGGWNG